MVIGHDQISRPISPPATFLSRAFSAHAIGYSLHTALTAVAALYAAMWLQLDVPRWSMWTVLIISSPSRGDVLRKTVARVLGTVVGCIAGVVFASLFAQDGVGYTLAMALWIGVAGFAAVRWRAYVAYGALLAGYTAAFVGTGTSAAPNHAFISALDRGSATMVGVLFTLVGSVVISHSDDVPALLAGQICKAAGSLLDWAAQHLAPNAIPAEDVPHAGPLLQLDTSIINANAERPALRRLRMWVAGIPTALLTLQSAVLELGHDRPQGATDDTGPSRNALRGTLCRFREVIRPGDKTNVSLLRNESDRLAQDRTAQSLVPAAVEAIEALAYLANGLEAILTVQRPTRTTRLFPPAAFSPERTKSWAAFYRAVVGVCLSYCIWNATSWASGALLLTNIATLLIIIISVDDPLSGLKKLIPGSLAGSAVGIAALYWLFPLSDSFLWLTLVTVPIIAVSPWILAAGLPPPFSLAYGNALVTALVLTNPQHYGLAQSIETVISTQVSAVIGLALFVVIDPGGHGQDRVQHTLKILRQALATARRKMPRQSRSERLAWETRTYDEIRRIHASGGDSNACRAAVHLLLAGRAAFRRESSLSEVSRVPVAIT